MMRRSLFTVWRFGLQLDDSCGLFVKKIFLRVTRGAEEWLQKERVREGGKERERERSHIQHQVQAKNRN